MMGFRKWGLVTRRKLRLMGLGYEGVVENGGTVLTRVGTEVDSDRW